MHSAFARGHWLVRGALGGAHCALCPLRARCAKRRLLWPHFPRWPKGTNHRVFMHRTTQIPTQSKKSDDELKTHCISHENSQSAVYIRCFCPVDVAPPVVGGLQGGHGNADLLLGTVQKRPLSAFLIRSLRFFFFFYGAESTPVTVFLENRLQGRSKALRVEGQGGGVLQKVQP